MLNFNLRNLRRFQFTYSTKIKMKFGTHRSTLHSDAVLTVWNVERSLISVRLSNCWTCSKVKSLISFLSVSVAWPAISNIPRKPWRRRSGWFRRRAGAMARHKRPQGFQKLLSTITTSQLSYPKRGRAGTLYWQERRSCAWLSGVQIWPKLGSPSQMTICWIKFKNV